MKRYITYKRLGLALALVFPGLLLAQTSNSGMVVISPNTQFSTMGDLDNQSGASLINDGEVFIYSNFNNDGVVDFTNGQESTTHFQGTNLQLLSGSTISYFNNVLFDNNSSSTGAFQVSTEISIANEANFQEGVVQNRDFGGKILFEDNAYHTGVYDGSHVDGEVQKIGDDSFTFPIGDDGLFRYVEISAPEGNSEAFSAQYYLQNPIGTNVDGEIPTTSTAGVITLLDTSEFWTLTNDSNEGDILLTLSWNDDTTPQNLVANPESAIHIVRWDNDEQLWVDEGGIVDVDNKTVTTPLRLDGYGIFTLGRVNESIILPGDVVIYNGVTPNGDGKNDYFLIDGIQNLPNNRVEVFNRWGVQVFEADNYDTNGNVFNGYSDGRLNLGSDNQLPTGTYYYVLSYDYDNNGTTQRIEKAGFLYITTE